MNLGQLRFPRQLNKQLFLVMLVLVLFEEFLISVAGLPGSIRYVNDLLVLILMACTLPGMLTAMNRSGYGPVLITMALHVMLLVFSAILGSVRVPLVLWAARNTFRFFIYFMICVTLLNEQDMLSMLDGLCSLQWLNLALCLFEYFVMHKSQDYLGGMFGVAVSCNSYLNVYLSLVVTYVFCKYLSKKCSGFYLTITLLSTMLISGLAELKIMYVELVAIAGMAMFFYKPSPKTVRIIVGVVVALAVGLVIMWKLFPEHYAVLVSLTRLSEYGNQEDGGYNLSRFHAFSRINELFFKGSVRKNLFGIGFGGGEYSTFQGLTSAFYRKYGKYNYRWFGNQMFFLETGYLGLGAYILNLLNIALCAYRSKRLRQEHSELRSFTVIFAVLVVVNLWYNAAIRTESAYLTYLALACGAVVLKSPAKKTEGIGSV